MSPKVMMIRALFSRGSRATLPAAIGAAAFLAASFLSAQTTRPSEASPDRAANPPATTQPTTLPTSRPSQPVPAAPAESAPAAESPGAAFALTVEKAHGAEAWRMQFAMQCDIELALPKGNKVDGKLTLDIRNGRVRLTMKDGAIVVFDGERAWFSPPTHNRYSARFSTKTWPYFLTAPFKLRDPGARLEPLGTMMLRKRTFNVAKLTFEPGTGDTPDDWYYLYSDPETGKLEAMAYIVTFGQSLADAEQAPHAITFENFVEVDGVMLATTWTFWDWSKESGLDALPVGRGKISNIRFGVAGDELFERPGDSAEDRAPEKVPNPQ